MNLSTYTDTARVYTRMIHYEATYINTHVYICMYVYTQIVNNNNNNSNDSKTNNNDNNIYTLYMNTEVVISLYIYIHIHAYVSVCTFADLTLRWYLCVYMVQVDIHAHTGFVNKYDYRFLPKERSMRRFTAQRQD